MSETVTISKKSSLITTPRVTFEARVLAAVGSVIAQAVQDYLTANPPTGGLTINDIKADLQIDAAIDNTHAAMSDNQDLSNLVEKETGKGLSTKDFTDAEQTKLSGIAENADVNVNADWNAVGGAAQILNKPAMTASIPWGKYF